ncbi:MAG: hypothetical protein WC928_04210 [Patescibacteria group bacterium]|jgi:hypothetical protein
MVKEKIQKSIEEKTKIKISEKELPKKKGMSKGAKIGLGVGIGCCSLILIVIILGAIFGASTTQLKQTPKQEQQSEEARKAEEAKKAEEARKAEEEKRANLKATAEQMSYETLYRNIKENTGKSIYSQGEVIQIMQDSQPQMRVNITKSEYSFWQDTVLVVDLHPELHPKILEKDIINFWGTVTGETSYQSVLGATVSLPAINAEIIEIVK